MGTWSMDDGEHWFQYMYVMYLYIMYLYMSTIVCVNTYIYVCICLYIYNHIYIYWWCLGVYIIIHLVLNNDIYKSFVPFTVMLG